MSDQARALYLKQSSIDKLSKILGEPGISVREETQARQPNSPWSISSVYWARVTGFTTGAFGAVDSGVMARVLRGDGTDWSTSDIQLFVRSFGQNAGEYGRIKLTPAANGSGGTYPQIAVGTRVWFSRMPYHNQMRNVILETVLARSCP